MNNTFYKILKFEVKQNSINWGISLLVFISITTLFTIKGYMNHKPFVIGGSFVPLLILFSSLITLYSYSESTNRQSMIMYHLLPVSCNAKFFSKQLITFIVVPLILVSIYLILAILVNPLVSGEFNQLALSPNFKPGKIALLFLWAHSFATFFAVLFKKRKLLYAFVSYFIFQFSLIIIFVIWKSVSGGTGKIPSFAFTANFTSALPLFTMTLIPLGLYIMSYHLFFKRQL